MNSIERDFDFLRVALESRLSGPSVIAVTCARSDDGAAAVASGLAEAFAQAGRETCLVSSYGTSLPARPGAAGRGKLSRMTAAQLTAELQGGRAAFTSAVANLRASYAVVVIDAEPIPDSALAFELARAADGVVIAIRLGRRPAPEDNVTKKLLADGDVKVLGIVPTGAGAAGASGSYAASDGDVLKRLSRSLEPTR